MSRNAKTILQNGYDAFFAGTPINKNPYWCSWKIMTWRKGWKIGETWAADAVDPSEAGRYPEDVAVADALNVNPGRTDSEADSPRACEA